jgi:uncharacterized membrane-anchored protein
MTEHLRKNKIPEVALLFWIMKICATTLGETAGNMLTKTPEQGRLGFGTKGSSVILLSILIVLIAYESLRNIGRNKKVAAAN